MRDDLDREEKKRLKKMALHEKRLSLQGFSSIAGIDEAGRGPLAGPVVAAACILPPNFLIPYINDSKQLLPELREALYQKIVNTSGIFFGIGIISVERIDAINILKATFEAMQQAVKNLCKKPDYLLIDGNQIPTFPHPAEGLVKGDSLSYSIAAASILAKVTRDRIMEQEAKKWPQYGFEQHKGYGTPQHLKALQHLGPCPIHRKSFEPIKSYFSPERGLQNSGAQQNRPFEACCHPISSPAH